MELKANDDMRIEIPNPPKKFVKTHLKGTGVEIGALHKPMPFDPDTTKILYADRKDTATLRKLYIDNPKVDIDDIVDVDIISDGSDLSAVENESVDFVCNSHLLEHLTNPLRAIEEWFRVLKKNGHLYIIVPDMHKCFDKNREVTPLEQFITKYEQDTNQVWYENYKDYFNHARNITDEAIVKNAFEKQANIHVHTWTKESLLNMLKWLQTKVPFIIVKHENYGLHLCVVMQKV